MPFTAEARQEHDTHTHTHTHTHTLTHTQNVCLWPLVRACSSSSSSSSSSPSSSSSSSFMSLFALRIVTARCLHSFLPFKSINSYHIELTRWQTTYSLKMPRKKNDETKKKGLCNHSLASTREKWGLPNPMPTLPSPSAARPMRGNAILSSFLFFLFFLSASV